MSTKTHTRAQSLKDGVRLPRDIPAEGLAKQQPRSDAVEAGPERPATTNGAHDLGADLLVGAAAIATFLRQPRRRVQHWLDTDSIPSKKTGNLHTALKSKLRRHFGAD
jgi:hypothetical protein